MSHPHVARPMGLAELWDQPVSKVGLYLAAKGECSGTKLCLQLQPFAGTSGLSQPCLSCPLASPQLHLHFAPSWPWGLASKAWCQGSWALLLPPGALVPPAQRLWILGAVGCADWISMNGSFWPSPFSCIPAWYGWSWNLEVIQVLLEMVGANNIL